MICSARASLPVVENRDGGVKQNRWVSVFESLVVSGERPIDRCRDGRGELSTGATTVLENGGMKMGTLR